ncbi:MAG TPA: M24 family metallopeptidase, partial [Alphaproteobacteria bacterium]|nr:M24 family metallopeptidase [Alphaproteobacteria bacterium]
HRADPCQLAKACKNDVELTGMRRAHLRDGVALSRFLAWLAEEGADADEISAAEKLEALRRQNDLYRGPSFATISAAGANAAIVHYPVTAKTNRKLDPGSLYLVDSGGQYPDGTTDATRTVLIGGGGAAKGQLADEMRDRFTRVLKGHIAVASAVFPAGATGGELDPLARQALWRAGLDYDHGTGHGVGCYLGVHEGPQRISKTLGGVALEPGMILSNEPGYYKKGAYGIRIENLMAVIDAPSPGGAERDLLAFETLSLAPIDRNLIAVELMTGEEIAWLDAYHQRVRDSITPLVDKNTARWLRANTEIISG